MSFLSSFAELSVRPAADVFVWVVMAVFLVGVVADRLDREELAVRATTVAWGLFAVFWLLMLQFFVFVHRSIVQSALVVLAVPACLYVGYRLWNGRESLLLLSRAVAFAGLIYLPFTTSAVAQGILIETVARQTAIGIEWLGYADGARLIEDPTGETALLNTFWFPETDRASRIVFACTGIGSMAIFGGLISAVKAPLRRKLLALAVAIGIIWVLNIARNVFIAIANGYQWFAHPALEGPVMIAFGLSDPARVSFFLADRLIAQGLALFALVGIALLIARWLPEILDVGEELLSLLAGEEVSLRNRPIADGGPKGER